MVRLKIINGKGEIKYIEGGADSITLGALGVVTEVTIKLVLMYWLKHSVEVVPDIVSACSISNIRKLLSENDFAFFRWSTVNGTRKSCAKRAHVETFNITSKSQITPLRCAPAVSLREGTGTALGQLLCWLRCKEYI